MDNRVSTWPVEGLTRPAFLTNQESRYKADDFYQCCVSEVSGTTAAWDLQR